MLNFETFSVTFREGVGRVLNFDPQDADYVSSVDELISDCYSLCCAPSERFEIIGGEDKEEFVKNAKVFIDEIEQFYLFKENSLLDIVLFIRYDLGVNSSIPLMNVLDRMSRFSGDLSLWLY